MDTLYWVIGGEYDNTDFRRVVAGTSEVLGPFSYQDEATLAWRERSRATSHRALVRYVIVSNSNSGTAAEIRHAS